MLFLFQKAALNNTKEYPFDFIHQTFCEMIKCIITVITVIIPQTIFIPTNYIIAASLNAGKVYLTQQYIYIYIYTCP